MKELAYISVTELNLSLKACFDSGIFKNLEIFGEVSGWKISGAHAYFTLKDKTSQVSCVCFNYRKTYQPKDGESIITRGDVDYYVKGGRLSFQCVEIRPAGQGLLALEFEKLKAKLETEGLFSQDHKKTIPRFCKNVLVVTSKTGAVIRDIVTTIRRKNPMIDIVVKDVRVQGDSAAKEITKALIAVDKLNYDVIIIARGGGSLEDLAPFFDEELSRTVYNLNTPVVSAVGHETDFSLCDFVADARAATPTAAAELVAFDYYALLESVEKSAKRIQNLCQNKLNNKIMNVQILGGKLQNLATKFYSKKQIRLFSINEKMVTAVKQLVIFKENLALNLCKHLDNLSPLKTLQRGYFSVKKHGKALLSVCDLSIGDSVETTGSDGKFLSVVEKIEKTEE
ncbi:MAG TPA: exodeoxyribonuclease VII large subunit [Clostridia bacterium]|nr:exodeoxyribonuclease VII large subunit [Clostridia bacterium]